MTTEFDSAKAFLMQANGPGSASVYDHLSDLIGKLLSEKPGNAVEILENLSYELKSTRFNAQSTLQEQPEASESVLLAKSQERLLKYETEVPEEEDDIEQLVPNVPELFRHFEDADIGLGREEIFRIFLALKQLADEHPLKNVSFWGKIHGLETNYIIAEGEFREGEEPQPEESQDDNDGDLPTEDDEGEEVDPQDKLPVSKYKPDPVIPAEEYGSGCNKKVYFVCSEAGQPWTMLPNTTPKIITIARQVRKLFTGRLDAPVTSYPPFPGTEADLLRAQIARITAGTHVSPLGLYTFDEEEDDEDEDARDNFILAEEFEGKPLSELLEPDLSGWVHHAQYVLPQGRCKWVNPNMKDEDEEDEEEDEEDEEDEIEAESGPPLLTPLQNDADVDGFPAWSPRLTNTSHTSYASVCLSSNRWPGAHAFAVGKLFANVYIGWGQKYTSEPYSPALPPAVQMEYAGEDISEAVDPTRQEEEEFEAQQAENEEDEEEDDDE
eukprot:TRINITY_DN8984_c0_g1_i2.p1 TRINITY_DN8984_c0_g1~~TRINITY_DN8984_c0_g1_i2.p1  ORF type:complete len:495 (+),score=148.71 TRINITY_DN8984_c0_g1_i2:79-1563(+)